MAIGSIHIVLLSEVLPKNKTIYQLELDINDN